jgi:cellulase/cellobiase CelA1
MSSAIGLARLLPGDNPALRRGWVVVGVVAVAAVVVWSIVWAGRSSSPDRPPALLPPPPLVIATSSPAPVPASMAPLPSSATPSRTSRGVPAGGASPTAAPARPSPTRAVTSLAAAYSVTSTWETGFIAGVHLTNSGTTPQNWTVTISHSGNAGVRITDAWNATLTRQGDTNVLTGGPLAPGSSLNVGFEATKQAPGPVRPSRCTVNQSACSVS